MDNVRMVPYFQDSQLHSSPQPIPTSADLTDFNVSLKQRISFNQLTTFPWSLSDDLDEYPRYGIPAIGLNWRKLTQYGLRAAIRKIQQSQMTISSLSTIGGFTGRNGYSISEVLSDARQVIRVAGQLRARTVTVVSGPQAGHIRSHANRLVAESLEELVPFAALYGVQLALQPMHPLFSESWSFLHSLDDAMTILERVGDSRLKLAFGTYHLWQEQNLMRRITEVAPRIGLVSLADWGDTPHNNHDWLLPGAGHLPLMEIIQVLESCQYSGWYELEVWSRDLWKLERRDLMRSCVASRDRLASSLINV